METPKVFASYSHDSDEHKQWVLKLCTKLVENGVEVILDQWDLGAGDDRILFMERGVRDSDRVLVICTDTYVKKTDSRQHGAGYEGYIITAELVEDTGTDKFIPIIRQPSDEDKRPTFLMPKVYINFSDDDQFDISFEHLLREIHGAPLHLKPPLGENPFSKQSSKVEESSHSLPEIPRKVESASDAYNLSIQLARADDILGWRQFVERIRPNAFTSLVEWREKELDGQKPESHEQLVTAVDKAVDIVSPLISVALVGVKSCNERFNNQKSLLDDLLSVGSRTGWKSSGYREWIYIHGSLGYVYHSLHGSLCLNTDQLKLSLDFVRVKIQSIYNSEFLVSVWEHSELVGGSVSLGEKYTDNWQYLITAYKRWEWLSLIYEDEDVYRTALVAYYLALHIHELASNIAARREIPSSGYHFSVPLVFLSEDNKIKQRAISLLLHNPALPELWTSLNVTQEEMRNSWDNWIRCCQHWLREVYIGYGFASNPIPHQNFFDAL